mgnify:CR=1 FL=1
MKRFFSLLFLIGVVSVITWFTYYTLNHKGIREDLDKELKEGIEKTSSNLSNDVVADVYSVFLNEKKHKLKLEYNVTFVEYNKPEIHLNIYLDGKSLFSELVANNVEAFDTEDLFDDEAIVNNVRIKDEDFKIIEAQGKEYLVIEVGYYTEYIAKKYFIYDENSKSLIKAGITKFDKSNLYLNSDNTKLDIFYGGDDDTQIIAKLENNEFYALVLEKVDKKKVLVEYKYFISEGKLEKEKINTISDIVVKEIVNKNKDKEDNKKDTKDKK